MLKIEIGGKVNRSFIFGAGIQDAFQYYLDFERLIQWLPNISLDRKFGNGGYRVYYHSVELGIYQVRIYCDLKVFSDQDAGVLQIKPLPNSTPVKPQVNLNSLVAQGSFSSESIFRDHGQETIVDYSLAIRARLPVPLAAQVIPAGVLDIIARNIMNNRIDEIVDRFITVSINEYDRRPS
jgi:hypothetical protein